MDFEELPDDVQLDGQSVAPAAQSGGFEQLPDDIQLDAPAARPAPTRASAPAPARRRPAQETVPVADEQPVEAQVVSGTSSTESVRMSPEDERIYTGILRDPKSTARDAIGFLQTRRYNVDPAKMRQFYKDRDSGKQITTALTYANSPKPAPKPPREKMSGTAAFGRGVFDSLPLSRVDAAIDAGANWVQGEGYNYGEELAENFDATDQAREERPGTYYSGMATGVGAQMLIPGAGVARLATLPGALRAGATGATAAAGYEVANTRNDLSTSQGRRDTAADAGKMAVVGGALGAGANKLLSRSGAADEALEAGRRQGLDLNPGRTGGTGTQFIYRTVEDLPTGFALKSQSKTLNEGIERRIGEVADTTAGGTARKLDDAADDLKSGALGKFDERSAAAGERAYSKAYTAAGDTAIVPTRALQTIDDEIARLGANAKTNAPVIKELKKLRDDLNTNGGKGVQALRDLRTGIGRNVDGSVKSEMTRISKRLYGPLSNDISDGLTAAGKADAAKLFGKADKQWVKRAETLDEIDGLLAKSPDELAASLQAMTGKAGNSDRLTTFFATATKGERMKLQGSFIKSLGRATGGKATQGADEFSVETFLTKWNNMGDRAKDLLFTGQTRRDLDDLAKVMGAERSYRRKSNYSKSGLVGLVGIGALDAINSGRSAEGGTFDKAAAGVEAMLKHAATGIGLAALLAIPGVARMITRRSQGARITSEQVAKRLEVAAKRSPNQAAQLMGLRDKVLGTPTKWEATEEPKSDVLTDEELNAQVDEAVEPEGEDENAEPEEEGNGDFYYDENGEKVPLGE